MVFLKISFKKCFVPMFGPILLVYFFCVFNLRSNYFEDCKLRRTNLQSQQLKIKEATLNTNVMDKHELNYAKHKDLKLREWYFSNGTIFPLPNKNQSVKLFPEDDSISDRIINQLMFVPPNYQKLKKDNNLKKILLYNGLGSWAKVKNGRDVFLKLKCPVDTCTITSNRRRAISADLILFKHNFIPTGVHRPSKQIYLLYFLECPLHTPIITFPNVFNWTATYRKDSDIVTPYKKWEYYDNNIKQMDQDRNYALNKTKKVAWFVSNCGTYNRRFQYARELQKYIDVDIYGSCGSLKCQRSAEKKCFKILDKEYKFYLAFENSNCKDYITEKFFRNALQNNILPIVMGARPKDYESSAPYRSYIHVDGFSSARELADYLHILDKDDELYNSYFKWKGTGEFISHFFLCRVCAVLNDDSTTRKPKWYNNVNTWWRGRNICTRGSW